MYLCLCVHVYVCMQIRSLFFGDYLDANAEEPSQRKYDEVCGLMHTQAFNPNVALNANSCVVLCQEH